MERKIAGIWCNPERMQPDNLLDFKELCEGKIERLHTDIDTIESELAKRAMGGVQMNFDLPKELPYEEV